MIAQSVLCPARQSAAWALCLVALLLLGGCETLSNKIFELYLEPSPPDASTGAIAHRDIAFASTPERELYLDLFRARINKAGLYLMDEPETPLSPTNVIALIAMIQDAVAVGAQFIIATHSPILMALPEATLLDVNQSPPAPIDWNEVEHVSLTRAFLNNPESFLRHL